MGKQVCQGGEMSAILASEVTQLFYRDAPVFNFAAIVRDLRAAFAKPKGPKPVVTWDCDDLAVLDFNAARLLIGVSENLPGAHSVCLTIAVGQSRLMTKTVLSQKDQLALLHGVADRLDSRFPCDVRQRQVANQPLSPDAMDRLVDVMFQKDETAPLRVQDTVAPLSEVPQAEPSLETTDPRDVDRLMNRLSSELVTRTPNIISRAIASATPKGRSAQGGNQTRGVDRAKSPQSGEVLASDRFKKPKLFWRKGQIILPSAASDDDQALMDTPNRPAGNDLAAVRHALCAPDGAQGGGRSGLAMLTKRALQTLVSVPKQIALTDRHRRDMPPPVNPFKH